MTAPECLSGEDYNHLHVKNMKKKLGNELILF